MNRFFTLLLAASCLTAVGQSEYCLEGTVWDEALQGCVPESVACEVEFDYDGDGTVGSGDLLAFLTAFGASFPDEDADGVCDEIDECVGEYDECGVCNGPGAVYDCGCEECAEFVECGDLLSYQGYDYETVQIGEQCWFAENLRAENYRNGDSIPTGLSAQQWFQSSFGAVTVYGEGDGECVSFSPDGDACDELWSLNEYGRLYKWYSVDDTRGLCPVNWHVPTLDEWIMLSDYLGGATVAGGQLASTYGWAYGENGSNSSGFKGLPGGTRASAGGSGGAGEEGIWWSSTAPGANASWAFHLESGNGEVFFYTNNNRSGMSVRCIKD